MRLTSYTNYSIRILMYCAVHPETVVTIADIAEAYGISRAHLLKSARQLGQLGYLETLRGRGGGICLAKRPEEIDIGEVVRTLEDTGEFVECFKPDTNTCPIAGPCGLTGLLRRGVEAFYREIDGTTLSDLVGNGRILRQRLALLPTG
jgi:Rrf2 family nitric oxide-sensitive transcriptional repressor